MTPRYFAALVAFSTITLMVNSASAAPPSSSPITIRPSGITGGAIVPTKKPKPPGAQ